MRKVPRGIIWFIENHDCFYVLGHREPDGDCIGSQLALASFLKSLGKRVHLLSSGPFTRSEILQYEYKFRDEAPPERDFERAAALVLDCSSMARIGSVGETMPKVPVAFIDHHASGETPGESDYLDPSASAVTAMVFLLMEAMGHKPSREEAELLFFGLCTDTGFFRHLDEKGDSTFEIAARMVKAGASPKKIYNAINGGKTLFSRKLLGEILLRIEPHFDGRLLISFLSLEDQQRYGMASRDSDLLYQLMMSVAGCEACFVIKQEAEDQCTVGFRSKERIDVSAIAARFGGGGHRLASGLSIQGNIESVKALLLDSFAELFTEDEFPEEPSWDNAYPSSEKAVSNKD
ncbi:MAG: bifunctional oligoribonuclease/PAP phosphatase NrnA [Spirochaetia bacterium]|jgi:phosphoesterase RecJ-like protein|uniref:DHH superfamily protein, subfamily 1 n=2 Tax=root TaxID=1 RepID=A0A652ZUP9_9SPIR|nr:bifunctional oligoribonuclease/PAP phosphatase NrnA [Spirochaetia bacterium]MCE1208254.1 bifunctional oligoribonuclease/PAP phosphatase NrnA [Spirochaetia bacterium]VBB39519.1 DHH superfamily protein, subfamily 1 [uncultured Spirochaetota bacterium]HOI23339.1 bifunctional oligoribonuclease/PAP phosphatase NrnA [Spirochaetales bacterium]